LEIRRNTVGENHRDFAQALTNLAGLYMSTDQYVTAEKLFQKALEIIRVVLGENHPDYAH
jgi:Tfp pilus assembly protein PilF